MLPTSVIFQLHETKHISRSPHWTFSWSLVTLLCIGLHFPMALSRQKKTVLSYPNNYMYICFISKHPFINTTVPLHYSACFPCTASPSPSFFPIISTQFYQCLFLHRPPFKSKIFQTLCSYKTCVSSYSLQFVKDCYCPYLQIITFCLSHIFFSTVLGSMCLLVTSEQSFCVIPKSWPTLTEFCSICNI